VSGYAARESIEECAWSDGLDSHVYTVCDRACHKRGSATRSEAENCVQDFRKCRIVLLGAWQACCLRRDADDASLENLN
jgi:hypothetical protein